MYTLPGVQTTQEMQHLREQVSNIDQILRIQQPQPQLNQLNSQRITLMAKLQTLVRQQQGAQIMQYPQGTPQQSISQAMQWMPPHPSQPRAPRRQMADPKEVQHRALAKLHMAPAPVPDQLGPEGAAAVQRRRGLLEAHDELERNNTWMQELLSPFDATTKQEPPETWDAIRERLTAWQARGEQLQAEQQAQHEKLRTGIEQDARRFNEALGTLKQAASLQDVDAAQAAMEQAHPDWQLRPAKTLQPQHDVPTPSSIPKLGQVAL